MAFDLGKLPGIVMGFIERGVKAGESAGATLAKLQEQGLGFRHTDFLTAFARVAGREQATQNYIQYIGLNNFPTIGRLPMSVTKTLRNFAYLISYDNPGALSEKDKILYVGVSSNTLLTKQQAIDAAQSRLESESSRTEGDIGTMRVDSITQNVGGLIYP